jgi:hypothetical protein
MRAGWFYMETNFRYSPLDVLPHELLILHERCYYRCTGNCRYLNRGARFTAGYEFNTDNATVPSHDLAHAARFETATEN